MTHRRDDRADQPAARYSHPVVSLVVNRSEVEVVVVASGDAGGVVHAAAVVGAP